MKKKVDFNVNELVEEIIEHRRLYYSGRPVISDNQYDKLEAKLRAQAPNHPVFNMVGTKELSASNKIKHQIPMLSLAKTYSTKELFAWQKDRELLATHKIDGNSLSLTFENKELVSGQTRGNGFYGEDVTNKVKWIKDIPQNISIATKIEIRGEVYCTQNNFLKLVESMKKYNLEIPSNPRNVVAGILGRKKYIYFSRFFNFFAFDVIFYANDKLFVSEFDKYKWLESIGFVLPDFLRIKTEQGIISYLDDIKIQLLKFNYAIDGIVFTYNDLSFVKKLGSTAHHPRYKMSFKWQGDSVVAKIIEILWSTSRLGAVTPVAKIEDVFLSGAKIKNVTLHNSSFVRVHNLKAGDQIEIVRSGEVIPKFLKVIKAKKGVCLVPDRCPSCASVLKEDEVRLVCTNKDCPDKALRTILNWIHSVGIEDLSEKRLTQLVEANLVENIWDLYKLKPQDFLSLTGMKEKLSQKLFKSIEKSKNISLLNFLNGLGIAQSGVNTWKAILNKYPSLEKIQKLSKENIEELSGFANKSAKQIVIGLKEKEILIDKLIAVGVAPFVEKTKKSSNILKDHFFVLSGTMSKPRQDIVKIIENYGGKIQSSVSNNTSALIVADLDQQSSKVKKAKKIKTPIWTEDILWNKLK